MEILWVLLYVLSFPLLFALIVSFFNDLANAIICTIIGIAGIVFSIIISTKDLLEDSITSSMPDLGMWVFVCTLAFYFLIGIRYLPCISVNTEKSTYLIFGTLLEETESSITGVGIAIIVPLLFAVGFYFLDLFLLNSIGFYSTIYAVFIVLSLHSIIGLIKAIKERCY